MINANEISIQKNLCTSTTLPDKRPSPEIYFFDLRYLFRQSEVYGYFIFSSKNLENERQDRRYSSRIL